MTDAERLDWLEKAAHGEQGLLLHAITGSTGRLGLGLSRRTLRQAIDQVAEFDASYSAAKIELTGSVQQKPGHHMSEWQPISIIPRSTSVLLYHPAVGDRHVMPAVIRVGFAGEWPNRPASHWMTLPTAPQRRGDDNG